MNDNWDFGCFWGKISAQKGIGISGPHQSLVTDVAPICDVYVFDIGEGRKITFSLSLCPVVKEYGITVRLPPECHNLSGRCWM